MARQRVALLWRGDPDQPIEESRYSGRLTPLQVSLEAADIDPVAMLYSEARHEDVARSIRGCSGVLVWIDPVTDDVDRDAVNELLDAVSDSGRWVSASPATISAIGTKQVLVDFQDLTWGLPCQLHDSAVSLAGALREAAARRETRVLKPLRGNGGVGVWKVAPGAAATRTGAPLLVRVQDARRRDELIEEVPLATFVESLGTLFRLGGGVVSQAYVDGLREGMVRAYLSEDRVVGFATQAPSVQAPATGDPGTDPVFTMAAAKTMYRADEARFAGLRRDLEGEWVPELVRRKSLRRDDLPVIWDLDFLIEEADQTRFVLCEINVSCVSPFPDFAVDAMVASTVRRVQEA